MISILYVSEALIDPLDRARILNDIRVESIARCSMLDITGLLIASPNHFAHLLEGPSRAVAAVMSSISADSRHSSVRTLREFRIEDTSHRLWRMIRLDSEYFGHATIAPLLMAAHAGTEADALTRLDRLIQAVVAGLAPVPRRKAAGKGLLVPAAVSGAQETRAGRSSTASLG